jgi:hypothetical protein
MKVKMRRILSRVRYHWREFLIKPGEKRIRLRLPTHLLARHVWNRADRSPGISAPCRA